MGDYIHAFVTFESYTDNIWIVYGPVLPDSETKDNFNIELSRQCFKAPCKGMVVPQKKEIKNITLSPEEFLLEGDKGFSLPLEARKIVKIENSASDPKAIKVTAEKASRRKVHFRYEN